MRNDGRAEGQHYVPKLLLRNFSFGKKEKEGKQEEKYIYVFDKHSDKVFHTNIDRIASERRFYDFCIDEEYYSLEAVLTKLEDNTKTAIQKIIKEENLSCLLPEESACLALFVSIQYFRVKKLREVMKQWNHDMADHINKMGYDPNDIEGFKKLDEEEVKRLNLESFVKHSPICTELIRNKICLLFKSSASHPLYISDNPVTMHNDENFGAYENIGFTALGIQIYLPISSILSIGFWCPTIQRKFEESWAEFERLEKEVKTNLLLNPNADREQLNNILKFFEKERQKHANFVKNAAEGTPIEIPPETVTLLNSLQVKWSYRFVMCEKNDFDLVKRMLNDNEGYREGAKIGIN